MSSVLIVRFGEPLGRVRLREGRAVPDGGIAAMMDSFTVVDAKGLVPPEEGERYLAALPKVLTGPVWAEPEDSRNG